MEKPISTKENIFQANDSSAVGIDGKIELKVEFWQKVKYYGIISVTPDEANILLNEDGNNIKKYLKKAGGRKFNPVYSILNQIAKDEYILDDMGEFEDFEILSGHNNPDIYE